MILQVHNIEMIKRGRWINGSGITGLITSPEVCFHQTLFLFFL